MRTIPMNKWGKDHWTTFAYVETCCVDRRGVIDFQRMRCNPILHPGFALPQHQPKFRCSRCENVSTNDSVNCSKYHGTLTMRSAYPYPTRLKKGTAPEHDDWDCFYDFEAAKLIEDIGTGINPIARLTALGKQIAAQLRQHKADGKQFAEFPDRSVLP